MDFTIKRSDGADPDFLALAVLLDADLDARNPGTRGFFGPLNKADASFLVVLALAPDGRACACGALKRFDADSLEVKRMYVRPELRGRGLSRSLLGALEAWARERGAARLVLETGARQTEALGLYASAGFERIPAYGAYADSPNSVCMEKKL